MTRLSVTFFGFLTFFLLVRMFSPTDFGIWVLFISVVNVMEALRTAFIYTPMIRFLNSSEPADEKEIRNASFILNLMTAGVIIFILSILSQFTEIIWHSSELRSMFLINIVAVICYTWSSHYMFLQQAANQFKGTFFNTLTQKGLLFFFILLMWVSEMEFSLTDLAIVLSGSYLLSAGVAYLYSRKKVRRSLELRMVRVSQLFHYGKYTFSTNIGTLVDHGVNEWLLGGLTMPSQVAMYNTSVRLANIYEIPLGAGGSIFYPEMVRRTRQAGLQAAKTFFERTLGFFLLIILPLIVLMFILARPVILLVAGEAYLDAVPVLRIMVFLGVLVPFQRQFAVLMNAIGKAKFNFQIILVSTVIFSVFKWIIIRRYGLTGAAYAIVGSYAVLALVMMQILSSTLKVEYGKVLYHMGEYFRQGIRYVRLFYKTTIG